MLLTSSIVFVVDLRTVQVQLSLVSEVPNLQAWYIFCGRKIFVKVADSIGTHVEMLHNEFRFSVLSV